MQAKGRAIILMMDSFGIGGAKDAALFGDEGSNTFLHIAENYKNLKVPNLKKLGLVEAGKASCGVAAPTDESAKADFDLPSKYGYMKEVSKGVIINELGEEHIKTGLPICYTSADSVFQIAAHEKYFGLDKLYRLCEIAFKHLKPYNIARVIARPFEGEKTGEFKRTKNRHDYSVKPPAPTVLDIMKEEGGQVISIGKISDIFAAQGITRAVKASGLEELWDVTLSEVKSAPKGSIIFTNFVDFDMTWGHRRDIKGYAEGLEYFDSRLKELAAILEEDDIVFITADHGCDPHYKGSDHTREQVPVIMFGKNVKPGYIGGRESFSDIAATIADYFKLKAPLNGKSFL